MRTLKSIQEEGYPLYYRYKCQHCGEELVMTSKELERVLFEPVEKEYEYWQGGFKPENRHVAMHKVSSDPKKDVFRFTCCSCGKENEVSTIDYWDHHCDSQGQDTESFILTEKQTKELRAWQKQQREKRKGMRQDAMGMAYTFTITPGGLGNIIHVKDNYTHDELDLTHTEDW